MGDLHVLELREQLAEQVAAQLDFAAGQVEVMAQLAGKLVAAARRRPGGCRPCWP
jgi:hypothetical protein